MPPGTKGRPASARSQTSTCSSSANRTGTSSMPPSASRAAPGTAGTGNHRDRARLDSGTGVFHGTITYRPLLRLPLPSGWPNRSGGHAASNAFTPDRSFLRLLDCPRHVRGGGSRRGRVKVLPARRKTLFSLAEPPVRRLRFRGRSRRVQPGGGTAVPTPSCPGRQPRCRSRRRPRRQRGGRGLHTQHAGVAEHGHAGPRVADLDCQAPGLQAQCEHDGRMTLHPGVRAQFADDEPDVIGQPAQSPVVYRRPSPHAGNHDAKT